MGQLPLFTGRDGVYFDTSLRIVASNIHRVLAGFFLVPVPARDFGQFAIFLLLEC